MTKFEDDPRLDRVVSRGGIAARDHFIKVGKAGKWHMSCAGAAVPHIQFRRMEGEKPYPYSLNINTNTVTFYVRQPGDAAATKQLLADFEGAKLNSKGEVTIPIGTRTKAKEVAARFFE
jgi:hypothetical protein